jgi:hypothetical protein
VVVQAALLSERVVQGEVVRRLLAARSGQARPRLEPDVALHLVREAGGNVSAAARRASIPRSTLRDLLREAAVGADS